MHIRLPHHLLVTLALLLLSNPAPAVILRVGPGCTYTTPQPAFTAAQSGDTVRIRSGNYAGPFVIARSVRIEGGYDDCTTTARSGRSDFHGNAPAQTSDSLLRIPWRPSGQVVLDRITLRDNIKTSGDGAGIHISGASLALNDVEIRNNRALDGNGGGIYLTGDFYRNDSLVELESNASVLLENNRANAGGAIAANGDETRVRFYLGAIGSAATFRNNRVNVTTGTSPGQGSAIYLYNGADAGLVDTLIETESGQSNIFAKSAIRIDSSPYTSGLLLRDSELMQHDDFNRYRAISAFGSNVEIEMLDTLIGGWGGGLALHDGNAVLTRVRFQNNGAHYGGGIALSGDALLEGHSLEFIDNRAGYGGAMAVLDNASWSISGAPGSPSRFIGNKVPASSTSGGAIYHGSSGSGRINDYPLGWGLVEFRENWAWEQYQGYSGRHGGAITIDNPLAQLDLRSPLSFDSNIANLGGAIYVNRGELSLDARPGEQIALINNHASDWDGDPDVNGHGGAIYRNAGSTVLINRTAGTHGEVLFSNNDADGRGGSIFSTGPGSLLITAPVRFEGPNESGAEYGGHIYAHATSIEEALVELQGWNGSGRGIVITGGVAQYDGGGMYLEGVTAILDWVQFGTTALPNRTRSGDGANLFAHRSGTDVTLRNSSLAYGRQYQGGGKGLGLFVGASAHVLMESVYGVINTPPAAGEAWPCQASMLADDRHCSEIINNGWASFETGGGVFVDSHGQLTLRGVNIDGNLGEPGGLLIENNGSVDARNVRVSRNTGGIQLLAGAEMIAQHLTVAGNSDNAIELADTSDTVMDLTNSVVWANSGGIIAGTMTSLTTACNISQTLAFGLFADPGFVHSARGLYRLGTGSPALDLCVNSNAAVDLDGNSRPQGNGYDTGAFEGISVPIPDLLFMDGFE